MISLHTSLHWTVPDRVISVRRDASRATSLWTCRFKGIKDGSCRAFAGAVLVFSGTLEEGTFLLADVLPAGILETAVPPARFARWLPRHPLLAHALGTRMPLCELGAANADSDPFWLMSDISTLGYYRQPVHRRRGRVALGDKQAAAAVPQ